MAVNSPAALYFCARRGSVVTKFIPKRLQVPALFVFALAALAVLTVLGVSHHYCQRNDNVAEQWKQWTMPRAENPPWEAPSNELVRFASDSDSVRIQGLEYQLKGYVDENGVVVIPPKFVVCGERFYGGLAWAQDMSGVSGYIDPNGNWQIVVPGNVSGHFIDGMGRFYVMDKDGFPQFGFVNSEGVVTIPPLYSSSESFYDGYVFVKSRTNLGKMARRLASEFGAFPGSCLYHRAAILDREGNEVMLPIRP